MRRWRFHGAHQVPVQRWSHSRLQQQSVQAWPSPLLPAGTSAACPLIPKSIAFAPFLMVGSASNLFHQSTDLPSPWQKHNAMLQSCHEARTSASGRNGKEHPKTAMHTIATLAYDAVNPFELAVATEVFGVERPELGVPWYRFWCALLSHAPSGPRWAFCSQPLILFRTLPRRIR